MIARWLSRPMWQRITFAFVVGIIAGLIGGASTVTWAQPLGDLYLNLMRMIVVPLIFVSVVASIGRLRLIERPARIVGRTALWFLLTAACAVGVGMIVAVVVEPGVGLSGLIGEHIKPRDIPSVMEVMLNIVPANPVRAFVDGNLLQLLFVATFFGAGLYVLADKVSGLRSGIEQGEELVFTLTRWVLALTPLGTFGLIASVVGHYGLSSLLPLGKFIAAIYLACLVHIVVVYGAMVRMHGLSVITFFRTIFSVQQMAFATASSMATLPLSLRVCTEKLGVNHNYASFALPLGATVKMDGCGAIYPVVAAVFIAQYFSLDLTATHYFLIGFTALLGSFATAGVPGTSLVILTLTLSSAGLPLEGIGYIIAIDRIIDMMRTATNVTGQLVVTTIVAREEGLLDEKIYNGEPFTPVSAAAQ